MWEEYKVAIRVFRDVVKRAKLHLELNLTGESRTTEGLLQVHQWQKMVKENEGPLLNELSALVTDHTEKADLLNVFFSTVFAANTGRQESETLEAGEKVWQKEGFPLVEEDYVRELFQIYTHTRNKYIF